MDRFLTTFDAFLAAAARSWAWLAALAGVFVVLALLLYANSPDRFATTAVITSRQSEAQSFDLASIGGLASLAGGGQRPAFEQFGYLLGAGSNVRRVLPALRQQSPVLIEELLRRSPPQRIKHNVEDFARRLFGKPLVVVDRDDRLVEAIQSRLKIVKTPEGYLRLIFSSVTPQGQTKLVSGLLAAADQAIRESEAIEYRRRLVTFQMLVDQQQRPSDRLILVSLMSREYATYVGAQAGGNFSYSFIEPPAEPTTVYATSLVVLIILAIAAAIAVYLAAIFFVQWRRAR